MTLRVGAKALEQGEHWRLLMCFNSIELPLTASVPHFCAGWCWLPEWCCCCAISGLLSLRLLHASLTRVHVHPAVLDAKTAIELPTAAMQHQQVVPDVTLRSELVMPDVARVVRDLERQGRGRKIIAMSLYGADPRYTVNAIYNAMVAQRDWPGWTLRIYYGESVPKPMLDLLVVFGAEIVSSSNFRSDASMFWRFFAFEDRTATRVIIRDADARLTQRDRLAVEDWMASDWPVHTLHDHQWHAVPILGGMWGAVAGFLHPKLFDAWRRQPATAAATGDTAVYDADQNWLATRVWPLVKNATLQHASWQCGKFGAAEWRPFPFPRNSSLDYVGQVYSIKSMYKGDFQTDVCPVQCRLPKMPDC